MQIRTVYLSILINANICDKAASYEAKAEMDLYIIHVKNIAK